MRNGTYLNVILTVNAILLAALVWTQMTGPTAPQPQAAIATPALVKLDAFDRAFFEPLEAMVEAALALCTADPKQLHGRIAFSLHLLLELGRPVRDLEGRELVDGWQPADLPGHLATQLAAHERSGTRNAYDFRRPSSPTP